MMVFLPALPAGGQHDQGTMRPRGGRGLLTLSSEVLDGRFDFLSILLQRTDGESMISSCPVRLNAVQFPPGSCPKSLPPFPARANIGTHVVHPISEQSLLRAS